MMELRPMIIDKARVIIGGNMRYKACLHLGKTEVPDSWVKKASDLTEEERSRFIIADNVAFGENDWEALANGFELQTLTDWGMEVPDFALPKPENATEDDFELPQEVTTDIVQGDIFQIGNHWLLCGDATRQDDALKLMNGNLADLIFTDPPYGVGYEKKTNTILGNGRASSTIKGDNSGVSETAEKLWRPAFKRLYESAKDECSFYMTMCQGGDQMMMVMMMMSEHWQVKHELIWVKGSPVFAMGRLDYDYKHEPIIYGWKKKHKFYGKGEFTKSVWDIPKPSKSEYHPTTKPIPLVGNAILNSSLEGQIVADFFMGSGTTMIACHQLSRICYGIEIDPKYCQIIIDRMKHLQSDILVKRNGVDMN
jgi:DNA modification methylase